MQNKTNNEEHEKKVIIYTDGACSGNPGPGGWGALIILNGSKIELSGGEKETTNQRMEMQAAIEALRAVSESSDVELYSDSAYLINCFKQDWIGRWQLNNWRTSKKEPVKNRELWERLMDLNKFHRVKWLKVKGHSNNPHNDRCDELAKAGIPKTG